MDILKVEIQKGLPRCKWFLPLMNSSKLTQTRAAEISQAYSSCPSTKLVASGYSQGGQLVHNSIALLPAATAEWISKVVIFGDPGMFPFLY
jgi:hypothetical protein